MQIEAIETFSSIQAVAKSGKVKLVDDSIETTAATFAVLHQMQRTIGAALDSDQIELIDILVRYGNNSDGIPALHYAIKMNDERAVRILLEHGADPNSLSRQIDFGDIYIINHGFIALTYQMNPLLPLDYAAISGNLKIIQLLIGFGANVNPYKLGTIDLGQPEKHDCFRLYSPLYFAAKADQEEAVRILIANGATIEPHFDIRGENNPLKVALSCESNRAFRVLLENTPDVTALVSAPGMCLLHDAAQLGNTEILKLLLERGAYADTHVNDTTPLMWAGADCAEILLQAGANPKAKNGQGLDAFYFAAGRADIDTSKILLKHGVDINALRGNNYPGTPFQAACEYWSAPNEIKRLDFEYLHFLLDNGADINARCNGQTALSRAKAQNKQFLVTWLIAHGAQD